MQLIGSGTFCQSPKNRPTKPCLVWQRERIVPFTSRWTNKAGMVRCWSVNLFSNKYFSKKFLTLEIESPQTNGTALMQKVPIQEGDTVGVAVQQSDLPMIQFLKNGEPLHHLCINRFRGSVYPSIFLPHGENLQIQLVLDENEFKQMSPHARFGPMIVARGII
jgi:hypothetical protein